MVVVTCPSTQGRKLDIELASLERLGADSSEVTKPADFTGDPASLVGKWIKMDQLGTGKVTKFNPTMNPIMYMYDSKHEVCFPSGAMQA